MSKFDEGGGWNDGGCQLDALGSALETLLSSKWGKDGARLVSPGEWRSILEGIGIGRDPGGATG